jgi:hypothetical protein
LGQSLIRRACHLPQRLANLCLGKDVQEGRLAQVHGEGLLERVVEYRVARRIGKVSQDDGVFLGKEAWGLAPAEIERSRDCNRDKYRGGKQNLPEFFARDGNFGGLHGAR